MGNCRSSTQLVIPRKPNPVVYTTKQQRAQLWAPPGPALDLHFRLDFRRLHLPARIMHGEAIHLCLQNQCLTNINAHVYPWQLLLRLQSKHSQVQQTSDWKLELVQLPVGDVYSNWLQYIPARALVQSSWSPLGEGNKKRKDLRQASVANSSQLLCS